MVGGALLEGADHGDVLHPLGEFREKLGQHDARDGGLGDFGLAADFGARLRVESIKVGHAARHVEIDDVLGFAAHGLLGEDLVGQRQEAYAHGGLGEALDESAAGELIQRVENRFHGDAWV